MYWKFPVYLWFECVPIVALAAWVLAERSGRRRLKAFGDPPVLGISVPWLFRGGAVLFLVSGLAFAAAVVPLPVRTPEETAPARAAHLFLLDVHSLESADDSVWDMLDGALESEGAAVPGGRFAVFDSVWPPRLLVPATVDVKGIQILVSRLRYEPPAESASGSTEFMRHFADWLRELHAPAPALFLTAIRPDDIERMTAADAGSAASVIFLYLPGSSGPIQYGRRVSGGGWVWNTSRPAIRNERITDTGEVESQLRLTLMQWFALMACFFFVAEIVFRLAGRVKV